MQVMILEEDRVLGGILAVALRGAGFGVLAFDRIAPAKQAARQDIPDLLVLGERVNGRLAHDVALLAEWRNPGLATVLLTDREGEEREELFDLFPSLRAALPRRTGARALARLTLAIARGQEVEGAVPALRWRLPTSTSDGREPADAATSGSGTMVDPPPTTAGPRLVAMAPRPASPRPGLSQPRRLHLA